MQRLEIKVQFEFGPIIGRWTREIAGPYSRNSVRALQVGGPGSVLVVVSVVFPWHLAG